MLKDKKGKGSVANKNAMLVIAKAMMYSILD
jgi:hypothetical protein